MHHMILFVNNRGRRKNSLLIIDISDLILIKKMWENTNVFEYYIVKSTY